MEEWSVLDLRGAKNGIKEKRGGVRGWDTYFKSNESNFIDGGYGSYREIRTSGGSFKNKSKTRHRNVM